MGQQGMANISAVAPGISSALLTTVVGLVVAIPSAVGSNKLNEKIRFLGIQMENFSEKFATAPAVLPLRIRSRPWHAAPPSAATARSASST
jgi:biopolymer transport protein ExbB/TolQ